MTVNDLREACWPTAVLRVRGYGTIRLRGPVLADDEQNFRALRSGIDDRELAVQVVHRQAKNPALSLEAVRGWPDRLVLRAARNWLMGRQGGVPGGTSPKDFAGFRAALACHYEEQWAEMRTLLRSFALHAPTKLFTAAVAPDSLVANSGRILGGLSHLGVTGEVRLIHAPFGNSLAEAVQGLADRMTARTTEHLRSVCQALYDGIQENNRSLLSQANEMFRTWSGYRGLDGLFGSAAARIRPDLSRMVAQFSTGFALIEQGEQDIHAAGFGFMRRRTSARFAVLVAVVNPEGRHEFIRDRFWAWSLSPEFAQRLEALFASNPFLYEAWPAVEQAYRAHARGDHLLCPTVWWPQIERLVTALMVLLGWASPNGEALRVVTANGKTEEIHSLAPKLKYCQPGADTPLYDVLEFLRPRVKSERNPILHGARLDYGTPHESTQGLLLLYQVAREYAETVGAPRLLTP